MKTAIIIGATGLTGGLLLEKLLKDDSYKLIKVFGRRTTGIQSSKLKEFIGDIINLQTFKKDFTADEVFCCIGTTAKKTKDKETYKTIDYGIPKKAAILAKENGIKTFVVISAMGANSKSTIFYNKTKGEMEKAVLKQQIENTYILRPSLIKGKRTEFRLGEDMGNFFATLINPFLIGSLRKYRSIKAETIAKSMQNIVKYLPKQHIILSDEIKQIAEKKLE
ncbi:Nucleoside-diphosphate sugar epimerase [Tenacibaculum sp. 190524A02b]|uniref:NAD(P)H-binding protein n=1 Tax=Tenacibaculum vairaonense TaxID=3137860 RepID=UPI0032B2180D